MGLPASPMSTGTKSSDLLPIVVRALVEAGWMERPAAQIVDAVSVAPLTTAAPVRELAAGDN